MVDVPTRAEFDELASQLAAFHRWRASHGLDHPTIDHAHPDHPHPFAAEEHAHEEAANVYGQREGPREVDSSSYYVALTDWHGESLAAIPVSTNLQGQTIPRALLPRWPHPAWAGKTLANGVVQGPGTVAVYAHNTPGMRLVDLLLDGFGAEYNHDGTIDAKNCDDLHLINVRNPHAGFHGAEVNGSCVVRGCDIQGDHVGIAGGARDGVFEDSIFRYGGKGTGGHHGAAKVIGNATWKRVEFYGLAWLDIGAYGVYEDCLFDGGHHIEIDRWLTGTEPGTTVSYSTYRNAPLNELYAESGNPGHIQHALTNVHMGHVEVSQSRYELDLNAGFAWTEWDDGRRDRAPSGVLQDSLGVLRDSEIVCTFDPDQPINGGLLRWQHIEQNRWERVVIRLPERARDLKLCAVQHYNDDGSHQRNESLTAEAFVAEYAPTCKVEYV